MMKSRLKNKAGAAILGATMALTPSLGAAESLRDALAAAYNHSGLLQQNRALLRAADESAAIALAGLRPILTWTSTIERRGGASFNSAVNSAVPVGQTDATVRLSASLLLYDGGNSRLGVEAAKENVLATRQSLISVEQSILLRAARAYISVLQSSETVQLRRNNVSLLREELRAAQNRFEVGEVTRTDVALAEARNASAEANLASAVGSLERAREEYAAAIGHLPRNLTGLGSLPKVETNEARAKSLAVARHPDLRRVQFDVNAAELNIRRAQAARGPTVVLEGSLAKTERFDDGFFSDSSSVGVTARQPLYRGGELDARLRQAMAQRDAERANLHVVRHTIQQNVGNAIANLQVTDASIRATQEEIRAAQVAFRGVREEAQLGQRTTLDVLTAEQDLLDARTNLTNASADRNTAVFELLSAQGLMTAEYLRLPVQQYDPAAYYNLVKDAPVHSIQGKKLDKLLKSIGKQ